MRKKSSDSPAVSEKDLAFDKIRETVINERRAGNGIGTLSEKTIHAVLKRYYAVLPEYEEIKCAGFVADICNGFEIKEIQTRQFFKCKRKLDAFLPDYDVTIVYPVAAVRYIRWIDPETGEISKARRSSVKNTPYGIFAELYGIREYLESEHLHFLITMLEVEEYKFLDGYGPDRKKRAHRSDGLPLKILDEISINDKRDYMMFIPIDLPGEFTVRDFSKVAKIPVQLAEITLNILFRLGLTDRIGKRGNAYLYSVKDEY